MCKQIYLRIELFLIDKIVLFIFLLSFTVKTRNLDIWYIEVYISRFHAINLSMLIYIISVGIREKIDPIQYL